MELFEKAKLFCVQFPRRESAIMAQEALSKNIDQIKKERDSWSPETIISEQQKARILRLNERLGARLLWVHAFGNCAKREKIPREEYFDQRKVWHELGRIERIALRGWKKDPDGNLYKQFPSTEICAEAMEVLPIVVNAFDLGAKFSPLNDNTKIVIERNSAVVMQKFLEVQNLQARG